MPENDVNALQNQNDNNIPTNIEPEIHEELPLNNPPTVEESPTNIFDDFIKNPEIQEAKDLQKEDKDLYYYLSLIGKLVQSIFVIFLVVLLIIYGYITLQKSEGVSDYNILDPFCGFILGDIYYPEGTTYCSSITYTKNSYERKLSELKDEELKGILTNLATLYERENFLKGKDITFILEESENKLKITEVLDKFDSLKREFLSYDKSKIQCRNMFINSIERTLEVTCDAYSQGYESGIIGFSGNINEKVSGTSLSVANSFLNFIEKKSSDFTLVDRQKAFSIENTFGAGYTKKTKFDIKLKINF